MEINCPTCTSLMTVPQMVVESTPPTSGGVILDIDESRAELRGFSDFYAREIAPSMATRQNQQRAARRWFLLMGVAGLTLTPAVGWLLLRGYGLNVVTFTIIGTMAVLTLAVPFEKLYNLREAVKGFLLLEVCRFFGFKYCRKLTNVEFRDFKESGLLPVYTYSEREDHIHGDHRGVEFDMFECRLVARTKSEKGDEEKQVYHGVLFRFAFPKDFRGRTLVLKDRGLIGNYVKSRKTTGERIKLEDPRFEKLFEVWGSDQVEARYLLTPTFMERLVNLETTMKSRRLEVCFFNKLLLISVHVKKNQFEGGGLFTSVTDQRRVEQLVNEICRVFDIVDTLQLTLKTRA
jgi:hypothetical protein